MWDSNKHNMKKFYNTPSVREVDCSFDGLILYSGIMDLGDQPVYTEPLDFDIISII